MFQSVIAGLGRGQRWILWASISAFAFAPPALATIFYGGAEGGPIPGLQSEWQRPTATRLEPARYESTNFFVTETGVYRFDHRVIPPHQSIEHLPRAIYLYADGFEPSRPRRHLMRHVDGGANGEPIEFSVFLAADVRYTFVVSTVDSVPLNFDRFQFRMGIFGPGQVLQNRCRLSDETAGDHGESPDPVAALDFGFGPYGSVCASVSFEDAAGLRRAAAVSRSRTKESVFFSFFDENNLEVQVKLVDGCAVNARQWLSISASTDRPFSVSIFELGHDRLDRSNPRYVDPGASLPHLLYEFPGGPAESIVDVEAMLCDD